MNPNMRASLFVVIQFCSAKRRYTNDVASAKHVLTREATDKLTSEEVKTEGLCFKTLQG